jgi:hypothetical protein
MIVMQIRDQVEAGATFDLPQVEIVGGKVASEQLSWPSGSMKANNVQGLREMKSSAPTTRHGLFAALTQRPAASVWLAQASDWRCTLVAPEPAERQAPGKMLLAQQQSEMTPAGHWVHQADWLLLVRDMLDLRVELPPAALAVTAQVNNSWMAPRDLAPSLLEIPLPVRAGIVQVRLVWHYPDDGADKIRPRLAVPKLLDLEPAETQGVVYLPPGYALADRQELSADEIGRLVALAQAATQACIAWSKKSSSEAAKSAFAAWHQQFQQAVNHLEYQARLYPDQKLNVTPAKLREEHQAALQRGNLPAPGGAGHADNPWLVAAPETGLPWYWSGSAPGIRLEGGDFPNMSWSREAFVLAIVGVFLLSWIPHGLAWFVRLWPEQLLLLAALGTLFWGVSVMACMLVFAALLGRGVTFFSWLRRALTTVAPAKAPSTLTPPSS